MQSLPFKERCDVIIIPRGPYYPYNIKKSVVFKHFIVTINRIVSAELGLPLQLV